MRCEQQDAALAEDASPHVGGDRHAPELRAVDVWDAVVPGEAIVDEGVVGGQQIENAPILTNHAVEQQLGLTPERLPKVVVEVRKVVVVRDDILQVAQLQPLTGEVVDQRRRLGIGEHPLHLLVQHGGTAERALRRHLQQRVVRNAAPQEEGQA